jgi:hypothetical protein
MLPLPIPQTRLRIQDPQKVLSRFLELYLERGIGSLSKRDADILLLHLLLEDGAFEKGGESYEISRTFKISETKARNLLQEVQLKYGQYSEEEAQKKMIELLEKSRFELEKKDNQLQKIIFIVRDPFLKQYFEEWVSRVGGFSDTSFNKDLIKISPDVFASILTLLYGEDGMKSLKIKLPESVDPALKKENTVQGFFKRFIEKYIDNAAQETGKELAKASGELLRMIFGFL